MESFSLLKYWKASGIVTAGSRSVSSTASATTIATSISSPDSNTDEETAAAAAAATAAEDGSFFDLEFSSIPNEEDESESASESEEDSKQLTGDTDTDSDPKSDLHQSPASLLKSTARFRVFAMGLKKLKSDPNTADSPKSGSNGGKFFIEVFTGSRNSKPAKPDDAATDQEEKKFTVQKYISKIKPLYIRVSRRYGERMRFSGPLTAEGGDPTAGVLKQMVKSRSAVAAVTSPPAVVQRRDDSLLQQEDGIQSAIAHCKMSFNSCCKETNAPVAAGGEETK